MWLHADAARYLVSTIIHKQACREVDEAGDAHLKAKYLRNVMGDQYARIMKSLTSGRDPVLHMSGYSPGAYSRGFRLDERFMDDELRYCRPVNPIIRDRLATVYAQSAEEQRRRWLPIDYTLRQMQRRLRVTSDAEAIIGGLKLGARLGQRMLAENIRRGWPNYKVSPYGRRFNGLTGIKREIRSSCLRLDGAPLANVDLRCAQPALLALFMEIVQRARKTPAIGLKGATSYKDHLLPPLILFATDLHGLNLPRPDSAFRRLVCEGDLYCELASYSGLDRDECKVPFMKHVLAKNGLYHSQFEDDFRHRFPSVHRFVRLMNRRDHANLIRILQRLEAWLVVETVALRLVDRIPIVTLHDAIYCRQGDETTVEAAFRQVFSELDFAIGLKLDPGQSVAVVSVSRIAA
jgi:hypothetical protein